MAKPQKKVFDGIFSQQEETDGNVVLFDAKGAPSVIFRMVNPVLRLCTDSEQYMLFQDVLANIVQTLGEGYTLQKQDIFCRQKYSHEVPDTAEFLTRSYFAYFTGREFTEITTYLIITQEAQKGQFVQYDPKKWLDFHSKVSKVDDILSEKGIRHEKLDKREVYEYLHRFMAFHFQHGPFSMTNFKVSDEYLRTGERIIRSYPLVDIDEINLPSVVKPYTQMSVNGYGIATDVFSFLAEVPHADCVVFNQVVQIPGQRKLLRKLQGKAKRHGSMPDPSNKIAKADIEEVLNILAVDSSLLVNTNFNIIVSCPADKVTPVTSFLETKLYECGIMPSRTAYNQLELFIDSFPGNAYAFNPDYDLFLTLSDAALCLFFKEHLKGCEDTPLTTYYTDRQGLPVCIDITGKEGKVKMTDNANFFCIGPSGSGKSFHMNSVVRQLLEQNTDVVMVDTGDSYEGICGYFGGTYISYSKEKPISMNPFKVTREEYDLNFGEKKNFLKSLIFLIFKGNEAPSKIEDMLVNQTIVEYYEAYFHPFERFSDEERDGLRQKLLVAAKMESDYEKFAHEMEDIEEQINREAPKIESHALVLPSEERRNRILRQCRAFRAMLTDSATTEAEKRKAADKLEIYKKELYENSMLMKIDKQIDHMEEQKRRLKVKGLSFNTYYEFALERIPQITALEKIRFDIRDFAAILKQFYRGGELEVTLNSDLDTNLFDERFIVFEIDKIKDDPVLFPIVVLIIMDVFLQKMRIKKGRKALIIEEAWKAIASPTMAEYIKFLYKTVRKFHGIAGVVTQELNDVIDSPIVKEAIINNSDVKILLDQSKFKDRYDDIAAILGLTPIQKQQIFTINALNNHDNRNYFKEVWICRGQNSDVYGVEEPPECYWAYTTERAEKEALKIYLRHYGTMQEAITHIEADRKKSQPTTESNVAMVKISKAIICALCLSAAAGASAQYRIVMDPYCLKAVSTNLASQKAIEDQHNKRLDSISAKQNKLEQYTVSMATITELYKVTMENISGFGTESKYYIEIGLCAFDIVKSIPELVKTVGKANFANKALCLNELGNLTAQTQQLVADFVNIVNNGKIQNPLKGQATAETKSDGYNFLDRYDRLTVANKIYTDLLEIRYKVQGMMAMAQYATKDDLFFAIDPEGWANIKMAQNQVGGLIMSWNGLLPSAGLQIDYEWIYRDFTNPFKH